MSFEAEELAGLAMMRKLFVPRKYLPAPVSD